MATSTIKKYMTGSWNLYSSSANNQRTYPTSKPFIIECKKSDGSSHGYADCVYVPYNIGNSDFTLTLGSTQVTIYLNGSGSYAASNVPEGYITRILTES